MTTFEKKNMCIVFTVHLDFLSIPVHDPESVLLVETLEHGQRDLPVNLQPSGHGILTFDNENIPIQIN